MLLCELVREALDEADRLLLARGYKRAAGSHARYIYVREHLTVTRGGVFVLPDVGGGHGQAHAAWCEVDGLIVSEGHLEVGGDNAGRITQATSWAKQLQPIALGRRLVIAADWNMPATPELAAALHRHLPNTNLLPMPQVKTSGRNVGQPGEPIDHVWSTLPGHVDVRRTPRSDHSRLLATLDAA